MYFSSIVPSTPRKLGQINLWKPKMDWIFHDFCHFYKENLEVSDLRSVVGKNEQYSPCGHSQLSTPQPNGGLMMMNGTVESK